VVGLHISRHGDGMNFERRPVKNSAMLVYTVGRSYLLESLIRCCSLVRSKLPIDQRPDALTSSLWRLRPKCATAGSSTVARQGTTMISVYRAPCWRGRHAIRICNIGPGPLSPRAGRPGRAHNLVREPGRKRSPRERQNLIERPACSASVDSIPCHF
jgi:hypothetical protein